MGALARRGDGETLGTAVTDHERVFELGGAGAVDVTAVQSSSHSAASGAPRVSIGSMVKVVPSSRRVVRRRS